MTLGYSHTAISVHLFLGYRELLQVPPHWIQTYIYIFLSPSSLLLCCSVLSLTNSFQCQTPNKEFLNVGQINLMQIPA